jgi:uncharacterized membrane protein YfcA
MTDSLFLYLVICAVAFMIAFMKGAFGGGLAVIGIPLLSLVMPPLEAGALLAPLLVVMDMFALRYWSVQTWSKPDLAVLVPSMVVGVGGGALMVSVLSAGWVGLAIALTSLAFSLMYFAGGVRRSMITPSWWMGFLAGSASGCATMIANAGGPPLAMYLLSRNLSKTIYTGTASIVAASGNILKLLPWLLIAQLDVAFLWKIVMAVPFIAFGVFCGFRLNQKLDQHRLFAICHALLILLSIKMLVAALVALNPALFGSV